MNSLTCYFWATVRGGTLQKIIQWFLKFYCFWKSLFQTHLDGLNCYRCGYIHTQNQRKLCHCSIPDCTGKRTAVHLPALQGNMRRNYTRIPLHWCGWAGKCSVFERFRWTVCGGVLQGDNNCVIVQMLLDQPIYWTFSIFSQLHSWVP